MTPAYAAVVYGLGGSAFDPAAGENYLVKRLKELGVNTGASPFQYYDSQPIYDFFRAAPSGTALLIIGDSFGACNAPLFAQNMRPRMVDYIAGFQPSLYGAQVPVPNNVRRAHCIYDPVWFDTFGLGAAQWQLAAGNTTTKLMITQHRGAHPDDWGYSQDLVFNEIKTLLGA